MPDVDLGDVSIHYEEVGTGPLAFIFLTSDHYYFDKGDSRYREIGTLLEKDMDFWAGHFGRAILWDYRGLGRSSGAAKYNLPLVASDLARLMDGLEIKSGVIYGYQFGGFVAQQFALEYPEKCAVLVLESTSPELNAAASEQYLKAAEKHKEDTTILPEHLPFHVFASRALASMREQPFTPRLKHIASPTLILAGALDSSTRGPGGSVMMSRRIPTNTLKIFEDGHHSLIAEKTQEVHDLVVQFSREHGVI